MKRTTIKLEEPTLADLQRVAAARSTSAAAVIREAVEEKLAGLETPKSTTDGEARMLDRSPADSGERLCPGLTAYLERLPKDGMSKSVSFGMDGGSLWIVTEVEAEGSLERLEPLFEAETAARNAADVSIVFRIIDRSIGERLTDGPQELTPIRL